MLQISAQNDGLSRQTSAPSLDYPFNLVEQMKHEYGRAVVLLIK